jgi:hypothetical protein
MAQEILNCQRLALGLSLLVVVSVQAEVVFGLQTNNTLYKYDSATPGTSMSIGVLSPIAAGEQIVGMDFRPKNGELIVMSYNSSLSVRTGRLYRANITTGVLIELGPSFTLPTASITDEDWGFDIDPVTDQARAVGRSTQRNLRFNLDTGALVSADTPVSDGASITGLAYSNNVAMASNTTLYGFNYDNSLMVRVGGVDGSPSANGGELSVIGTTGGFESFTGQAEIDISGATGVCYGILGTSNVATTYFYTVNLSDGNFTRVGLLSGRPTVDLAVQIVALPTTITKITSFSIEPSVAGSNTAPMKVTLVYAGSPNKSGLNLQTSTNLASWTTFSASGAPKTWSTDSNGGVTIIENIPGTSRNVTKKLFARVVTP